MGYCAVALGAGHMAMSGLRVGLFLHLQGDCMSIQVLRYAGFFVALETEGVGRLHACHGLQVGLSVACPALLWPRFLGHSGGARD